VAAERRDFVSVTTIVRENPEDANHRDRLVWSMAATASPDGAMFNVQDDPPLSACARRSWAPQCVLLDGAGSIVIQTMRAAYQIAYALFLTGIMAGSFWAIATMIRG
jgi:hypothetical protein